MVNCQVGGSCNGGDPAKVYEYAYNKGIPDSSCEQYVGSNLDRECTDSDICQDCLPPVPTKPEESKCGAVNHKKYYVSEYYSVRGVDQMKSELAQHGPIGCGIEVTEAFVSNYEGGIYSEKIDNPELNHEISVVGYGVDAESGEEYWVGRNSWGTYWGEMGFFRMKMYRDNLGIETDCTAGIPSYNPNVHD